MTAFLDDRGEGKRSFDTADGRAGRHYAEYNASKVELGQRCRSLNRPAGDSVASSAKSIS